METKYCIAKYFDTHFEGWDSTGLTKEQADERLKELNSRSRAYVSYEIQEQVAATEILNPKKS